MFKGRRYKQINGSESVFHNSSEKNDAENFDFSGEYLSVFAVLRVNLGVQGRVKNLRETSTNFLLSCITTFFCKCAQR